MTESHELVQRNADFVVNGFERDLTINPSGNLMVVGCVDPRDDPAHVLGLSNGEAAIIRNVGGRITPDTLRTMTMLGKVGAANASTHRPGDWNLVILHHTELEAKSVTDPVGSVRADVDVILQAIHATAYFVTGLVYDVDTRLVQIVVPPTALSTG